MASTECCGVVGCGQQGRYRFASEAAAEVRCVVHGLLYWPVCRRDIIVALVVGTILMLINQADVLLSGHASALVVAKGRAHVPGAVFGVDIFGVGRQQNHVTQGSLLKRLCRLALLAGLTASCTALVPAPTTVECAPLPDASQTLLEAWQAYQPDESISLAVTVRRRLFAFQSLLLSAGMYDDQPPTDQAIVYATYSPQFVRDFGMSRNPGLADALRKLDRKLLDVRNDSEAKLGNNCGLILARRALRDDAINISTEWILQTVTWGFAAYFQSSIRQLIHEHALTCGGQPEVARSPEAVLDCTMRRVGV